MKRLTQTVVGLFCLAAVSATGFAHSGEFDRSVTVASCKRMAAEFAGIGAALQITDGKVIITKVLPGSPALKAGIKSGDIITRVDDKPIKGLSLSDVVKRIRGPVGTEVEIRIQRGKKTFDKTLKRARIEV